MRSALGEFILPTLAIAAALASVRPVRRGSPVSSPVEVWKLLFKGAFGDWFSWQNTLQRAAPLMLTALCVAIPARAGLVIIGGEGAHGCWVAWLALRLPYVSARFRTTSLLARCPGVHCRGALPARLWIMLAGWLRQFRGINETISSLLLAYVAIGLFKHWVEGPLRDPASLNKPSTFALAEGMRIGGIAGSDIHWGLVLGVLACIALGVWLKWTASGFSVRVVGGNPRTAQLVGLPASRLILLACAVGGACAGPGPVRWRWRRCTPAPMRR